MSVLPASQTLKGVFLLEKGEWKATAQVHERAEAEAEAETASAVCRAPAAADE